MDIAHKGVTSGNYQGVMGNWPDYCLDYYNVFEFQCTGQGVVSGYSYNCPTGCAYGACASEPEPTPFNAFTEERCTDTDGGVVYGTKGTVHGVNKLTGTWKTETDKCDSLTLLIEEYCDPNPGESEFLSVLHTCPTGCMNGACNPG